MCPVCNGFQQLQYSCPICEYPAVDQGRLNDMYGPYSAYRPIDDIKLTNGYADVSEHECIHVILCPRCDRTFPLPVQEQLLSPR
nr:hypothetical protein [Paenibacillus turpanensis]